MSIQLNKTHDAGRRSWIESANAADCPFPIQNLPFGVFKPRGRSGPARGAIAIGDAILDVSACAAAFEGLAHAAAASCSVPDLNGLMSLGPKAWSALRHQLSDLLSVNNRHGRDVLSSSLFDLNGADMYVPAKVHNFTDFFASIDHAINAGRLFRPNQPLLPNYKYVPVAYNGRSSSIVVSGTAIRRPRGQIMPTGEVEPNYGPCRQLDYEVELGIYLGAKTDLGEPVRIENAWDHIFGFCVLNDWSARDIQSWEYQPLGPFLGKTFATSVSPWIVTAEALLPFRVPAMERPNGDPAPLPHLYSSADQLEGGLDVTLECSIQSREMRKRGSGHIRLSRGSTRMLYWTPAQMIAHQTSNGCNLEVGDLLGSGTVSGATPDSLGSLLEITRRGANPIDLRGELREFLADGDDIEIVGSCRREGFASIGFGACTGTIEPAAPLVETGAMTQSVPA
ncbi:fumarylacetoacetase [Bradyrhizobium sp. sBnM-33]|uniref:fumarylacetoacetase n=1 Tax=Bradyrhizobium sp. sBnM-33 TaxID=2831780 RepID=UPI001BCD9708|nr:fumarylacetoacetase [Bradyrhizobium sp. sBnM-33]WOH53393.1 fumarylacetoacetase [Bradyrhizobium sp. sBnM-33]